MKHFTLPRRAAVLAGLALGTLAILAGCSKRLTSVDAGYTTLEGRPDPGSRLLAWPDTPDTVIVWADLGTPGPDPSPDTPEDTLLAREVYYRSGPGVIHAELFDRTAASGFQFFRRARNGGLQALTDFTIQPALKWLSSNWELYALDDTRPSGYAPATYVARGLLDDRVTTSSPLTNNAVVSPGPATASIRVTYARHNVGGVVDSTITWTDVPAASGYWLDIYQFTSAATSAEKSASGTPNPVLTGHIRHRVIAWIPNSAGTTHTLTIVGTEAQLLAENPLMEVLTANALLESQEYLVRVTAVDGQGNVLAWTRSRTESEDRHHDDYERIQFTSTYKYYPLAAIRIPPPVHRD